MASYIKKGESIFIPFRNGQSISDSQLKPRMYKTVQAFIKSFPGHYLGNIGVELAEYAEVVRCKDCKHCIYISYACGDVRCGKLHTDFTTENSFCSYGEMREGE